MVDALDVRIPKVHGSSVAHIDLGPPAFAFKVTGPQGERRHEVLADSFLQRPYILPYTLFCP